MLFIKLITVDSENCTEHINTLPEPRAEFFHVRARLPKYAN